jgi:hypothetical protein
MAMNLAGGCLLLVVLWFGAVVLVSIFLRGAHGGDDDED